jgi:DNA-binding transcriptional MocR family regulator
MTVRAQYQIAGRTANAISASVEAAVEAGDLPAGAELPSVRALAGDLGVSPATVAAAYRALRSRGVVVSAERRGVRVALRSPLAVRALGPLPEGVRDLATGNPDPALLPPLPPLRSDAPRLYGQAVNLAALTDLARERFRADGVDAGGVAVVSGALDGIERVLGAQLRPGDRVAVEDPGYPGVLDLCRALGLELLPVPVDERGPRPDALTAALAGGAAAVVLTPRAQNPVGAALDDERAEALAGALAASPDPLLLEDDHAGAIAGAPYRTLTPSRRRWAVVRSVSKSLGPDLRVAALAADPATLGRVEGRQRLGPGWVSHLLQGAVAALWADPGVARALEHAAATYAQRRGALIDALAAQGIAATGGSGLNVWVPVPEEATTVRGLLRSGWAVQAGEAYRVGSPPAVRVTVATLQPGEAPRLAVDLAALLRPPAATNRA